MARVVVVEVCNRSELMVVSVCKLVEVTKEGNDNETFGELSAVLVGTLVGKYLFRMQVFEALIMSASFLPRQSVDLAYHDGCGSRRHSLQVVELSQRCWQAAVQIVSKPPAPAMGARFPIILASQPSGLARWMVLLLKKPGDVEKNPGPTTTHKQVWIFEICHKHK